MAGTEQKPLKKAEIARHWGKSRAYLTLLAKPAEEGGKAMPDFYSLAEADAWRAVHAPPRESAFAGEQSSPKNPAVLPENRADNTKTTTGAEQPPAAGAGKSGAKDAEADVMPPIDISRFIRRDVDFDTLMIEQASQVPQIAYGLLLEASKTQKAGWISAATKNWQEASRAAGDVRERFLTLQERSRVLLTLDEVMDVVGTELQAVRTALEKLGERCAMQANPADPASARRAIDAEIDAIFTRMELTTARTKRELAAPAA